MSDDGCWLTPVAIFDPDPEALELLTQLLAASPSRLDPGQLTTIVVETGLRRVVPSLDPVALFARFRPEDRARVEGLQLKSIVLCPLRAHGKGLGLMSLLRHGANVAPFDERDADLAQTLADHAALAISNASLQKQLQRQLEERSRSEKRLELLSELAQEFAAATRGYDGLLNLIARRLGEVVGEACSIRILNDRADAFELVGAVFDPDPRRVDHLLGALRAEPQKIGEGVSGRVAATGQSVLIPAITPAHIAQLEPRFRRIIEELSLRSLVVVPLRAFSRVIGVIAMYRSRPGPGFTLDDQRLVEDLATHAALAIANSRLLQTTERELADRLKAEEALSRSEEQLRQAQKMEAVGRLAGGVAHDFNNLLSVVLSYSGLLLADLGPDDPSRPEIEEIQRAGERAADLTRQLLAFSRQQVISPRVLDLDAVVSGMDKMIRRMVGEDIQVKTVATAQLGRVKADPGHIEQVIMNLIVNARDAMPKGGNLTIETGNVELDEVYAQEHLGVVAGPHTMLAVSDTGTGIDKATQERIFEPFFTTKEAGKGTGLGLSTVFGIVKQSGGSVWVYSEVGKGTTFKVFLPVTTDEAAPVRAPGKVRTLRGSETILLVEDEEQVRGVALDILQRNGYHVLHAASGTDAIRVCEKYDGAIQLLLTDVVMPRMSGPELARRLVVLRPQLRVLFMSGYTEDAIVHHHVVEPGVNLFQKPITPDALLMAVRAVLEQ